MTNWEYDENAKTYRPPDQSVGPHRHASETVDLVSLAASLSALMVPVGVISAFYGATAPTNWLLCDGVAIPAQYVALIALVGANTPNLKGRAIVGLDAAQTEFDALGETGGAKIHTLVTAEMPVHAHGSATSAGTSPHTHGISNLTGEGGTPAANRHVFALGGSSAVWSTDAASSTSHVHPIASEGSGTAHNNLQPYIAINYIIKAA